MHDGDPPDKKCTHLSSVIPGTRAMAAVGDRVVTVFGGTGFLGRRIIRHLRLHGFYVRVASRNPARDHEAADHPERVMRYQGRSS